jgi:hypothetical protein
MSDTNWAQSWRAGKMARRWWLIELIGMKYQSSGLEISSVDFGYHSRNLLTVKGGNYSPSRTEKNDSNVSRKTPFCLVF